ncbi:MAG: NarK/NasA family nitrate transporter [Epsilonproteobacteria bacterium]|nr:MFS transporter [Campylobacterota bacterium]NPA56563.1 NarK/NasA family nitrate transporter [Campylobacterota bacterium]
MRLGELKRAGHLPTLIAAFLYFDFSFMVWTMLGPLATEIAESLARHGYLLDPNQKATLLAIPILGGAILRILLGFLVDNIGPKRTAILAQSVVIASLFYTYFRGESITYYELLAVASGLGFAGASFAVALPQAGQWYPPRLQGLVLGLAGAGNIGVVIDYLFAPKIAEIWGWPAVFLVGGILSTIILITYILLAKDAPPEVYTPREKSWVDYLKLLRDRDTWWFSLFYAVSFGGFVGFANYMKVYLMNVYQEEMAEIGLKLLSEPNVKVVAGYFGALCIFAGAMLRPVGGAIADRLGGVKSLYIFYGGVFVLAILNTFVHNFHIAIVILFLIMSFLGMANGAVFQLVPQRFGRDMGIMTGIVGCAGGLGGTALIKILGWSKATFGTYAVGFYVFAGIVLLAIVGLSLVKTRWRTTWGLDAGGRI